MASIAKQVWQKIKEDIVIRRAIEKKIISTKNLAMHLIKVKKVPVSIDAVVSAIRRYKEDSPLEKKFEQARKILRKSNDIKMTSNIAQVVLRKNKHTQKRLVKAFELVDYDKGELLIIMQGERSLKLMVNEKNLKDLTKLFPPSSLLSKTKGLALINIHMSEKAQKIPGVGAIITQELTLNDISMWEMMSSNPDLLLFLEQKDLAKTYEIIYPLCQ
ncbi:hypothetical protein HOC01_03945 [archaeon]|jgi:aspartokinase|nr:hypothetical protein [archaeon]MBT6698436.1 hypothetical protein [archaeon]